MGGLSYPFESVFKVCLTTEKLIRKLIVENDGKILPSTLTLIIADLSEQCGWSGYIESEFNRNIGKSLRKLNNKFQENKEELKKHIFAVMIKMFRMVKPMHCIQKRPFKNFGHKREPEAVFTVLWHGFLTFSFIGLGIEWKRIYTFIFGEESKADSLLALESIPSE